MVRQSSLDHGLQKETKVALDLDDLLGLLAHDQLFQEVQHVDYLLVVPRRIIYIAEFKSRIMKGILVTIADSLAEICKRIH